MLSEGYTWRPATLADAEPILSLTVSHNTSVVGFGDCTLDDVRSLLLDPRCHLETGSWVVHGPSGEPVGYGLIFGRGDGEQLDAELVSDDGEAVDWLFRAVLARARSLAEAAGHHAVSVNLGLYRDDKVLRAAADEHGFTPATTFHRMRVDHGPEAVDPVAPQGVVLRSGPGDEAFRRVAHEVLMESFREHYGYVNATFEQWHEVREAEEAFSWSQLTVAELGCRPVGVMLTTGEFVESENCGYIGDLGVLASARGRGIGTFLLRTAFAADIRAGRVGTLLNVDTNNTTPALHVYESVGMRPVLMIDAWRREWRW
jgi:ribosomal protein S18 acetylase RimI-like enzyme